MKSLLRFRWPLGRGRWVITAGRAHLRAEARAHGRVVWAGESTYVSASDLGDSLAALVAESSLSRPPRCAMVELDQSLLQVRRLDDLPPVRRSVLTRLITVQSGRYFRKNGHPLVTDAMWTGGTRWVPRRVHAVAADEPTVRAILSGAAAGGVEVLEIRPAQCLGPLPLSLLPPDAREARRVRALRGLARSAALVATLWAAVLAYSAGQLFREDRMAAAELQALAAPTAALQRLRGQMAVAETTLAALQGSAVVRERVARTLVLLSRALPDSVFLTSLALDAEGNGRLSAVGPAGIAAVAALERAQAIANPRLEGGSVREVVGGRARERFTIAFGKASP